MSLLSGVVETFGPFLIPAFVFAAGAVGYLGLLALNRLLGTDEASKWYVPGEEESDRDRDRRPERPRQE